jgi:hypothetical protein
LRLDFKMIPLGPKAAKSLFSRAFWRISRTFAKKEKGGGTPGPFRGQGGVRLRWVEEDSMEGIV